MSIIVDERDISRPVNWGSSGGDEVLKLIAMGSNDEVAIYNAVMAWSPTLLNGLIRGQYKADPQPGGMTWYIDLTYRPIGQDGTTDAIGTTPTDPSTNAPADTTTAIDGSYSFDISVETVHVTRSIKTMARIKQGAAVKSGNNLDIVAGAIVTPNIAVEPGDVGSTVWISSGAPWLAAGYLITAANVGGGTWTLDRVPGVGAAANATWQILPKAEDYAGAINYVNESIEGCDVFGTRFDWTRTVSYPAINRNYQLQLRSCVGKKNNAPFYGCLPGECVYLGATGQYTQSRWSITHKFSEIANESNILIREGLIVPFKRGWDYLWVRYKPGVVGGVRVNLAESAYVEEVVPDANFSLIGIGA